MTIISKNTQMKEDLEKKADFSDLQTTHKQSQFLNLSRDLPGSQVVIVNKSFFLIAYLVKSIKIKMPNRI